ncbi:regulator of microtubule dynamics protein 1 isoform X1 [Carcharodon carcharias]|uniref:regulator of microtubule dynamics protein 1 isoform X1 n=2 Tax=Carcharodon carcharias TaxID=13397 RepID=UPI001B7DD046|nr:regulator of microtubule dynamics protein 1 isoform X1 [Carcharodon carcharias]
MAAVGRAAFTRFVLKAAMIRRSWSCRVRPCGFGSGVRAQVLGGAINLGRGLTLTLMTFLGYEAYRNFPGPLIVHADQKVEEIIDQADYLYGTGEVAKLYHLLIEHKNSTDGEILWRLARASRDLAQLENTSMEKKKQLTYEALEFAKKALEKNELSFAAHKWYAICISDVGDYEGTKAKIANAYVIKEHFQKAIELNPKDATSIHLMGLWCFTFAELPWVQQKIAAMFFATPPSSTYKEALQYFNKAEEADPNFYSKNLLMMGKTYMKLKNEKLALLWLTKARDYPARNEEDKQVQKEATELLKSIKRG